MSQVRWKIRCMHGMPILGQAEVYNSTQSSSSRRYHIMLSPEDFCASPDIGFLCLFMCNIEAESFDICFQR